MGLLPKRTGPGGEHGKRGRLGAADRGEVAGAADEHRGGAEEPGASRRNGRAGPDPRAGGAGVYRRRVGGPPRRPCDARSVEHGRGLSGEGARSPSGGVSPGGKTMMKTIALCMAVALSLA